MHSKAPLIPFGGVDAGGTKWACAVGTSPENILAREIIDTTTPSETLGKVRDFFLAYMHERGPIAAIGVSSFGPLIRHRGHRDWGQLFNSPKAGWERADIGRWLERELPVPIGLDTDVNGSALAEQRWGRGMRIPDFAYITVGTGVGGAIVANGKLVTGVAHSELGHFRPRRHVSDDYHGNCPYHADCYEGLISGLAIRDSTGVSARDLDDSDPTWEFFCYYVGQLCHSLLCIASCKRIILGGGLFTNREHLLPLIRQNVIREMGGYLRWPTEQVIDDVIVVSHWAGNAPEDGLNSGVFGGFIVAEQALQHESEGYFPD